MPVISIRLFHGVPLSYIMNLSGAVSAKGIYYTSTMCVVAANHI